MQRSKQQFRPPSPNRDEAMRALRDGMDIKDCIARFGISRWTASRYAAKIAEETQTPPLPPEQKDPKIEPAADKEKGLRAIDRVKIDETTPPEEILGRVRGVLAVAVRPKVLEIAMPELLYPAMVISQQEWHWEPMKPEDFIDTILDQFIRATGIELNTYLKVGELERVVKFATEHGYKATEKVKEEKHDGSTST